MLTPEVEKKYGKDIQTLEELAAKQQNRLNFSTISFTLKTNSNTDIREIVDYFAQEGIEVLNNDVDLEEGDYSVTVKPFDPSKIDIKMDKITIDSIIKRIKNDELEFDSSFQRKAGLWNVSQKSRLIESILLKIPLPAFYFDASNDDRWQIIDGLQRISTIREFVLQNGFKLQDLEFLTDFNNCTFDTLPRSLQRRIEETNLNAYLVNPSTPKNVKFNIFKRINTGGLILEAQEIRNALYQGQAANFLETLSQKEEFQEAVEYKIKSDRMLDREFCLRYISFTQLPLEQYEGSIEDFLNQGMEYLSDISKDRLLEIEEEFVTAMKNCRDILGIYAFRKVNEEKRRGPINKALFEAWSVVFSKLPPESIEILKEKRGELLEKYIQLCMDSSFLNSVRSGDKNSVSNRISKVEDIVNQILAEGE